jgi:hypothetical protein
MALSTKILRTVAVAVAVGDAAQLRIAAALFFYW